MTQSSKVARSLSVFAAIGCIVEVGATEAHTSVLADGLHMSLSYASDSIHEKEATKSDTVAYPEERRLTSLLPLVENGNGNREIVIRFPVEAIVGGLLVGAFLLFHSLMGGQKRSPDLDSAQPRRSEKSIHRGFHTGKPGAVLKIWEQVVEEQTWLSRAALEIVFRSMIMENKLDVECFDGYVRNKMTQETEQVRLYTSIVEMCTQKATPQHLNAIVQLIQAQDARGRFRLSRLASYLSVLSAFASSGDETRVDRIFTAIQDSEGAIPHRAFVVCIMGYLKANRAWLALRVMRHMEENELVVPGQCVLALFQVGGKQGVLSELVDQALTLNSPVPPDAFDVLARFALSAKDFSLGEKVTILCQGGNPATPDTYVNLARLFVQEEGPLCESTFEFIATKAMTNDDICREMLSVCMAEKKPSLLLFFLRRRFGSDLAASKGCTSRPLLETAKAACELSGLTEEARAFQVDLGRSNLELPEKAPVAPPGISTAFDSYRDVAETPLSLKERLHYLRLAGEHRDDTFVMEVLAHVLNQHGEQACCDSHQGICPFEIAARVMIATNQVAKLIPVLQKLQSTQVEAWAILLGEARISNDLSSAKTCMQSLKSENIKPSSSLYAHMLAIYLWMLAFDEARMLVLEIRDADMWSVEVMSAISRAITALVQDRGEVTLTAPKQRLLAELIRVAEHNEVSEEFGRALINSCINLDMLAPLVDVLPKLPRESTAMYTAVMKVYATLGKSDSVMEVWNELTQVKQITPTQVCLGQALNALASHNCPTRARALLQEWRSKVQPNCVMYTTVMKGLGRAKDFDGAKEVWKEMLEDGIEANVKAYNTLLDACARAGRMDTDGAEIMAEMEANKIPVVSVTVSTAVKGFCHRGMLSQAAAKLGKSGYGRGTGGEEASAYNAMLDGCVKAGDFARFDQTYADMQRKQVRVTSFTLTALVKRYGNAGHITKAYNCVETLCAKYGNSLLNVHVATCLISASFRNRAPERAIEFFKSMPSRGLHPDGITYATVMNGTKSLSGPPLNALQTAVSLAEEALSGPGLPTHAVEELINRLKGQQAMSTLGQSLVTSLKKRHVEVPRPLLSAVARATLSH